MKVLVTGATGFVGRHLIKRLKSENVEVTERILKIEERGIKCEE